MAPSMWVPGVMVSQIWPRACYESGATGRALHVVAAVRLFQAVQIVHVETAAERAIVAAIVRDNGLSLTYCAARTLGEDGHNLSSLDEEKRTAGCDVALRELDRARECGACRLSLVSGPAPSDREDRRRGLDALQRSLTTIAEAAARSPAVIPVIEPLDWDAHKRGTLGTVQEALAMIRAIHGVGHAIGLCADTSHMLLNGEDPVGDTLPALRDLAEYHLCNPVLDRNDPQFGDRHLPFGPPGALDVGDLNGIVNGIARHRNGEPTAPVPLFLEVLNRNAHTAVELLQYNREILAELIGDGK